MGMKVIIVGGVAGGATAASRLKRMNEEAEIILFEKGEYISYANCGLPYYIGEVIKDKNALLVQTPQGMKARYDIDVRANSEVIRIHKDKKMVEVSDRLKNTSYMESYDKLIIATGAETVKPEFHRINSPRICTLRNIPDTYRIKNLVDKGNVKRAIIIGAGYIGLEMAENLRLRDVAVSIIELAEHVIGPLDTDMASYVHKYLREKGIDLHLKTKVVSTKVTEQNITAELSDGISLEADMIIIGTGVRPETGLAVDAGISVGMTGGILVDECMRTTDPDIYAVGDAIEVQDFINGNPAFYPLASPANKQGRIAANNICGIEDYYMGTQGTSIVKFFDMTIAVTGNNEKVLKKNGIQYEKSTTSSPSHANYYPGGDHLTIKLIFAKDNGKVLGTQIIGLEGVDKRIDVIATAIRAGMTVYDLEKLELAYAPPFSSAKDPVNIAGSVAGNILKGYCMIVYPQDVEAIDMENSILLDTRTESEFEHGTIANSINIQLDEIRDRLDEIPRDKKLYVFCQRGSRSYVACRFLMQKGYRDVWNLSGGYLAYQILEHNK